MRAEVFFCNLDVLNGGLGIGKLQFLIKKKITFFFQLKFFSNFWSIKPWIRIGIQPKMLVSDPDEMNADPQFLDLTVGSGHHDDRLGALGDDYGAGPRAVHLGQGRYVGCYGAHVL